MDTDRRTRIGAAGLAFTMLAGCSPSEPERTPRPLDSWNYRMAVEVTEDQNLVVYSDELPFRDDVPFTIIIERGFCQVGCETQDIKNFEYYFGGQRFQFVDQSILRTEGSTMPPVEYYEP